MDYPSDPTIGLVDGKFSDGDAVGGVAPSRDTAAWANAVTDEIVSGANAMGMTADEADNTQLGQALAQARPHWISAEPVGSAGALTNGRAVAAFNETDVVTYHTTVDDGVLGLRRFDGSAWSLVGSELTITGGGLGAVAVLNATDVAWLDEDTHELRVYRFDGAAWAQVGAGLYMSGWATSLAALTETDVAVVADGLDLRTYRFDGATWSQVGAAHDLEEFTWSGITALSATDVAIAAGTWLRTYRFDGATWSQVGAGLDLAGEVYNPALAALNRSDIVFIQESDELLRVCRFDGSAWTQLNTAQDMSTIYAPALAALSWREVVLVNPVTDTMQTYRYAYSLGTGPYRP